MPPSSRLTSFDTLPGVLLWPSTTSLPADLNDPRRKRFVSIVAYHHWCYVLHGFLFIIQIALFVMLWGHPEHAVTIAFNNSVLTIGLSAFLQAFYTLYTALLVFMTQRLAIIDFFAHPQKLTAIHDISGAWAGLGATTTTLWQQTKIAASTKATLLIFVYLSCVSILHVASPTVMEFEAYNATATTTVPSNSSRLSASVNLTALNMDIVTPLMTLMPSLTELSTDGLINSTLYDTFSMTPQMVSAAVNADTIQANCGLLSNLSYSIKDGLMVISASTSGGGRASFELLPGSFSYDEVLFLTYAECTRCQSNPLAYLVSTSMDTDGSVGNNVSLNTVSGKVSSGGISQNSSTTIRIVACSLGASNHEYNLEIQDGKPEPTTNLLDTSSGVWSLWTPLANNSGTQLNQMVASAYLWTLCTGICNTTRPLDSYLMSLLNINVSTSSPSVTLAPYQLENAVSQMASQLLWTASQLSEAGGGFTRTTTVAQVTEQVARWRLNINKIPVAFTLGASLILLVTLFFVLDLPSKIPRELPSVKGATVLEMLWIGAHTNSIRKRLQAISWPTAQELRSGGMIDVDFTTDQNSQEGKSSSKERLLKTTFSTFEFEDATQGARIRPFWRRRGAQGRALPFVRQRHLLCHLLHGIFVLLHIVLLCILIRHPEHRVILQSVNEVYTTGLTVSLELFYVVYTLVLVYITQRLAISQAMAWMGIGSALAGVWQQTKVTASLRMTLAIATYYLCISVLHIASSTVIQFEVFSSSRNHMAQSTLAWPTSLGATTYNWFGFSRLAPLSQLPGLSTNGLVNNTVYDTPLVNPTSVNATVNATTIQANCGLLSNLSLGSDLILNVTVPGVGEVASIPEVPSFWKDTVYYIDFGALRNSSNVALTCSECDSYLVYWVTTALDLGDTRGDVVSVYTDWTFTPPGGNATLSKTTAYVVACSLNATTTLDVLNVQSNALADTSLPQPKSPSQLWSLWSPGGVPALGTEVSMGIANSSYGFEFRNSSRSFSTMDIYTMSLLGLNLTANNISSATESSANPSVTLTRSQFENAISQVAAQYIWAAGHTNGHFGPEFGHGESTVTDLIVLRRLNVNEIPAVIASVASVLLFILALCMLGVAPSKGPTALSELGVLEMLWLEAHSNALHERMLQVDDPTLDRLRVAGMVDVCVADDVREALDDKGPGEHMSAVIDIR